MKSVLKYPGAKNRQAPWICKYIPAHDVYLEPFAGSLAVLFHKERSHIELLQLLIKHPGKILISDTKTKYTMIFYLDGIRYSW
ncbi:MAG: DNA adenine methylase [Lachnospiraceae bacterium]